jgi:hypothetical protein
MRVRWLTLVLGLALVVACSGITSGPLDQGNDSGALCGPVASDGSITVGIETLVNSANEPVVIDSVHMVESRGMSIIDSRIVTFPDGRDGGATLVGVVSGYPPEETEEWSRSVPAVSAEIPPADMTSDVFNLVLGLQIDPGSDKATASAIDVAYTVEGATHTYRTTDSIELVRDSC